MRGQRVSPPEREQREAKTVEVCPKFIAARCQSGAQRGDS